MKKTKSLIVLLIVLCLFLAIVPFRVFANESYTLTFAVQAGKNHTIVIDDNRLKIDGGFVEARNASDQNVGTAKYENGVYKIVVESGEETELNFGGNSFTLYVQGHSYQMGTKLNANEDFQVQDYEEPNQPGPGPGDGGNQGQTYNVNFGTATWTVGGVNVTAIMTGKTINNSQNVVLEDNDVITLTNYNPDTMEVRITENTTNNDAFSTTLTVNLNDNVATTKIANRTNDGGVPNNLIFSVQPKSAQPEEPGDEPGNNNRFNGKAYFVWLNSNNQICYHKFENLEGSFPNKDDNIEYIMNYINVTDLTDQSGNNSAFVWGQENANWVLADDMEDNEGNIKPEALTKNYIFGDGEFDMGVQLNPCGAIDGANSLCTNGDRNFRATIYREGYQAIKFSSSESDYTYFPRFWDPIFFSSVVDISGTTASNPAEYDTYLLEPTITFTNDQLSGPITSVEALNINPNAVDIRVVDGACTIKFNSNYYDNVVFKIIAGGKKYFVKVNRLVIDVRDNFAPGQTDNKLIAELYYPNNKTYNDFEVIATIVNKDGSTETKNVPVSLFYSEDNVNDMLVNDYTLNGGKGLYCSQFSVSIDKDKIVGAYFTVVNKGALKGNNYGGTFSGSGKGSYYNLETRRVEL